MLIPLRITLLLTNMLINHIIDFSSVGFILKKIRALELWVILLIALVNALIIQPISYKI